MNKWSFDDLGIGLATEDGRTLERNTRIDRGQDWYEFAKAVCDLLNVKEGEIAELEKQVEYWEAENYNHQMSIGDD